MRVLSTVFAVLIASLAFPSFAAVEETPKEAPKEAPKTILPTPEPVVFESRHSGTFHGQQLDYRVVVSDIQLRRAEGTPFVDLFTTAYLREKVAEPSTRPVTFVFNGGPGSSSVWLHLGLFGPQRVVVPSDAKHAGSAPYSLVANPLSPLDLTDLVFIDPAGTGFSRLVGDGKVEDVYGLQEDARTIAALIREWTRANRRWNAPILLAGESFGTTRAAALLPELMGGSEPLAVSGVILISQALDYQGSSPWADNLTSFVTYLPTMAATAWYHGKVEKAGRSLQTFLAEVEDFAVNTYLPALFLGSRLEDSKMRAVAARFAQLTGLDTEYVVRSRLRVQADRFRKELLRAEGLAIGRLDGRYAADEVDDMAELPAFDAAHAAIGSAYSAALHQYMVADLGVTLDRPYYVSGPDVGKNWVWNRAKPEAEPVYVNTARDLAWALSYNPALRVLVTSGYYDYATPYFDAKYTLARHGIDLDRVTMTWYEAGHMMYVHDPSLSAIAVDIHALIASVLTH